MYREDALHSLELMRNPESGLVRDKIRIVQEPDGAYSVRILNNNTSPTNIALDLINHMADVQILDWVLAALEKAPFHKDTGLFFSWYSTEADLRVMNRDLSSIDNIHLSLALWTIAETHRGTPLATRAQALFRRMRFSAFYDKSRGLMGGNLRHDHGVWVLDAYRFSNLGSEARSIYSVVWALNLLRDPIESENFIQQTVDALTAEFLQWNDGGKRKNILKTWDGGAFQLLLPRLFLNEEKYSAILADSFQNYADYILKEGKRRGYSVPAAHSASNFGVEDDVQFEKVPAYNGKSGDRGLVSSAHVDIRDPRNSELWDAVFTPHAAIMAATADPSRYEPVLRNLEKLHSGGTSLYRAGIGFMDGYHVKGIYKGRVVPVQLSLDQGMIALALDQIISTDGLSPSGRALAANKEVRLRMSTFYKALEAKLKGITK